MNFYDREDCINLSPYIDDYGTKSGVFVIKNALDRNLVKKINDGLKSLPEKNGIYDKGLISWYSEKIAEGVDGTIELWEAISEILAPNWVIHPTNNFLAVRPGDNGMFIHSDSPGKGSCHLLSQTDLWSTCCELDYGVIAYFGDYEGGEIFYPGVNPDGTLKSVENYDGSCLEYAPENGDIVIHSAFDPYGHGVREVTSGIRYAFSNFCLKAKDNPGTFYNYGTPEYYEQIGNKTKEEIKKWATPLKENPQFTDEKIKIYQQSGLEGENLAKKFFSDMKPEN
jgi:hypothetical protein